MKIKNKEYIRVSLFAESLLDRLDDLKDTLNNLPLDSIKKIITTFNSIYNNLVEFLYYDVNPGINKLKLLNTIVQNILDIMQNILDEILSYNFNDNGLYLLFDSHVNGPSEDLFTFKVFNSVDKHLLHRRLTEYFTEFYNRPVYGEHDNITLIVPITTVIGDIWANVKKNSSYAYSDYNSVIFRKFRRMIKDIFNIIKSIDEISAELEKIQRKEKINPNYFGKELNVALKNTINQTLKIFQKFYDPDNYETYFNEYYTDIDKKTRNIDGTHSFKCSFITKFKDYYVYRIKHNLSINNLLINKIILKQKDSFKLLYENPSLKVLNIYNEIGEKLFSPFVTFMQKYREVLESHAPNYDSAYPYSLSLYPDYFTINIYTLNTTALYASFIMQTMFMSALQSDKYRYLLDNMQYMSLYSSINEDGAILYDDLLVYPPKFANDEIPKTPRYFFLITDVEIRDSDELLIEYFFDHDYYINQNFSNMCDIFDNNTINETIESHLLYDGKLKSHITKYYDRIKVLTDETNDSVQKFNDTFTDRWITFTDINYTIIDLLNDLNIEHGPAIVAELKKLRNYIDNIKNIGRSTDDILDSSKDLINVLYKDSLYGISLVDELVRVFYEFLEHIAQYLDSLNLFFAIFVQWTGDPRELINFIYREFIENKTYEGLQGILIIHGQNNITKFISELTNQINVLKKNHKTLSELSLDTKLEALQQSLIQLKTSQQTIESQNGSIIINPIFPIFNPILDPNKLTKPIKIIDPILNPIDIQKIISKKLVDYQNINLKLEDINIPVNTKIIIKKSNINDIL